MRPRGRARLVALGLGAAGTTGLLLRRRSHPDTSVATPARTPTPVGPPARSVSPEALSELERHRRAERKLVVKELAIVLLICALATSRLMFAQ